MAKKIKMNASKANGKIKNKKVEQDAKILVEKGEIFGDSIIAQLTLTATDLIGIGAASVGLAKALAALKDVARRLDVSIDNLFDQQLSHYERVFAEITDLEEL